MSLTLMGSREMKAEERTQMQVFLRGMDATFLPKAAAAAFRLEKNRKS